MQELDQTQELIQMLKERLNEKDETIATLQATIKNLEATVKMLQENAVDLKATIANLTETLNEFKRKFFGISSEKSKKKQTDEPVCEEASEQESGIPVKEHTRTRKKKAKRDDLYALLPIEEVLCDVPQQERLCPDCGAEMEHMGYTFIREELRITPAKVVRVRYMQEKLICPVCREEDDTTITQAKTPTALMPHSPASPDMVAMVMYQKSFLHLPFYRQEKDWKEKGVPLPRETAANWYNTCALEYLLPIYQAMHVELISRSVIHADEVPCQVLHEEGKAATCGFI